MAVIRCQACGKPNPDFLDTCQYCDARLKPLTAPLSPSEPAPAQVGVVHCQACGKPNPASLEVCQFCESPLRPLTGPLTMPETAGVVKCQACGKSNPAFLDVCQFCESPLKPVDLTPAAGMPALSIPTQEDTPAASAVEEAPNWLSSLRGATPAGEPETPDWLAGSAEAAAPAEDIPDWLRGMQSATPSAPEPEPAAPAADVPDWMSALRSAPAEPATPAEDVPDWLRGMQRAAPSAPEPEPAASAADVPDWMSALRAESPTPAEPSTPEPLAALSEELPDWLRGMQSEAPVQPAPETPAAAEVPDWMSALPSAQPESAVPLVAAPSIASEEETVGEVLPPSDSAPDWLLALRGAAPEPEPASPEEMPDWLRALRGVTPAKGTGKTDFLRVLQSGEPEEAEPASPAVLAEDSGEGGLTQAALPAWLAAMRPVDVEYTALTDEADTYEERVGVLAGMRGVLRAEPTVALPRKSTVQVHKLDVSEGHAAQVKLLIGLLTEEGQARPAPKMRVRFGPLLERLIIVAVLLTAILLPPYLVPGLFPPPATITPETQAAFATVEGLPVDRPALVIMDYDPSNAGELDPAAAALMSHLMRRGIAVVTVSTRPLGAAMGDVVLVGVTEALSQTTGFQYASGTHYLNLGYLPGGAVGIAQFAADPRSAILTDFAGTPDVWAQPVVGRVNSLGDFGAVVLVTASPDSARAWIEQTQAFAAQIPMFAALSAGADPLVRPYYEGDSPRLRGLVSGLFAADQYQRQAGQPEDSTLAWRRDMLGSGLFAAAILLAGGNLVYALMGALRRPRR